MFRTGDVTEMKTFDEFYDAYKKQMEYFISLLVNADNAIDVAHAERCPLPFLSCMVDDCMKRGKSVQEGGAVYNFTGPQGFGIANMADSLYAIRKLVYEEKKVTMEEMKEALAWNYGKGIDAQSAADITTIVMQKLQENGIGVNEQTATGCYDSSAWSRTISGEESKIRRNPQDDRGSSEVWKRYPGCGLFCKRCGLYLYQDRFRNI